MPSISQNKYVHRFDSATQPTFTANGVFPVGFGYWFTSNGFYLPVSGDLELETTNKTDNVSASLRNLIEGDYSDLSGDILAESLGTISKVFSEDGYSGATGYAFTTDTFSAQIKTDHPNRSVALSLQSGTITYNPISSDCECSFVFGFGGQWSVWQSGVRKAFGTYEENYTALLVYQSRAVMFFLIDASNRWQLVHMSRPNFSGDIKPVFTVYSNNTTIYDPYLWNGQQTTASLEVQAVLDYFQGWGNNAGLRDTFERVQLESGGFDSVRTEKELKRRFIEVEKQSPESDLTTSAGYTLQGRATLETFIRNNALGDFWFIDRARGGNSVTEFWAHFEGDFTDVKDYANSATVRQTVVESVRYPTRLDSTV